MKRQRNSVKSQRLWNGGEGNLPPTLTSNPLSSNKNRAPKVSRRQYTQRGERGRVASGVSPSRRLLSLSRNVREPFSTRWRHRDLSSLKWLPVLYGSPRGYGWMGLRGLSSLFSTCLWSKFCQGPNFCLRHPNVRVKHRDWYSKSTRLTSRERTPFSYSFGRGTRESHRHSEGTLIVGLLP